MCIISIMLYRSLLWYFKSTSLFYPLKELRKMQRRVILWITGTFCTLPTLGIEAIMSLIPIHLHLQKISKCQYLRTVSLLSNHAFLSLMECQHSTNTKPHQLSLDSLTLKQCIKIKSAVSNNWLNDILSSFDKELFSRFHLLDNFPNCFSFYMVN